MMMTLLIIFLVLCLVAVIMQFAKSFIGGIASLVILVILIVIGNYVMAKLSGVDLLGVLFK